MDKQDNICCADLKDSFIDKVKKTIEDLLEASQVIFHNFTTSLE